SHRMRTPSTGLGHPPAAGWQPSAPAPLGYPPMGRAGAGSSGAPLLPDLGRLKTGTLEGKGAPGEGTPGGERGDRYECGYRTAPGSGGAAGACGAVPSPGMGPSMREVWRTHGKPAVSTTFFRYTGFMPEPSREQISAVMRA